MLMGLLAHCLKERFLNRDISYEDLIADAAILLGIDIDRYIDCDSVEKRFVDFYEVYKKLNPEASRSISFSAFVRRVYGGPQSQLTGVGLRRYTL